MKISTQILKLFLMTTLGFVLTACPDKKPTRSDSGVVTSNRYGDVCPNLTGVELENCIDNYIQSNNTNYSNYWMGVLTVPTDSRALYRSYLQTLIQQPCDTDLSWSWPIDYDDCDIWDERIGIMIWGNAAASTGTSTSGQHLTSLWKLLDNSIVNKYRIHVERMFWLSEASYTPIVNDEKIGISDDKISIWIDSTSLVQTSMSVQIRYQGKVLASGNLNYQ